MFMNNLRIFIRALVSKWIEFVCVCVCVLYVCGGGTWLEYISISV